jgi:hypothetical protein
VLKQYQDGVRSGDFRGPIEDLDGQREGFDAAIEKRADILFEARHARTLRSPQPVCHTLCPVSSSILAERAEACGMVFKARTTGIRGSTARPDFEPRLRCRSPALQKS